MYSILAHFIVKQRRTLLILTASIFTICAVLATGIEFDFTPQQIFASTGDNHEYREVFAQRFGREDNVVSILLQGDDLLEPQSLRTMRDLTYELRQLPAIVDAQSVATLALPREDSLSAEPILASPLTQSTDAEVARPIRGPVVSQDDAAQLASYAATEPLIAGRLISHDRRHALIVAWLDPNLQQIDDLAAASRDVAAIAAQYNFPDSVTLEVRGIPPLRVEIAETLRGEQAFFVPLTVTILLLVLFVLFRTFSGVILPLATVLLSLVATVALLAVTGSNINIINNVLPTLILVIGVSDSIHMLTRQAEEVAAGKPHHEAVKIMIRQTGAACLLTTGTTAVGFLSLMAAETTILRNFGWQAGAGVMFAYLFTLFSLTAALLYLRPAQRISASNHPSTHDGASPEPPPFLEASLLRLGNQVLAHPWVVLTVAFFISGIVIYQGTRVEVDSTVLELFGEEHPTARATRNIEDHLGGLLPMEISFEAAEFDRFKDPELYRAIATLQSFAMEQEIVLSSESYVDYLQTARVAVIGESSERENLASSRSQIEQLLLLISDAPDSKSGIGKFATGDFRNTRLLLRIQDAGANDSLALARSLQTEIDRLFAPFPDVKIRITGDAYVAAAALSSFIRDLLSSLFLAIGVIFFLLTLVFRSLKIGLISLIPNTLPLLITFGYMGFAGINLNTTTIIIFAISLGIAVDDAIHFFARFVEERQNTGDLKVAILNTYFGAGRAILLTSVLLLLGLSVLTLSEFVPTRQFGLLTGMTIAAAVVADLVILPAILYLVYSHFPEKPTPRPGKA